MNRVLGSIRPSASMAIGLAENLDEFLNLAIGIPDLAPPEKIKALLQKVVEKGSFEYVPSMGSAKAVSNLINLVFPKDRPLSKEVLLVNGAKYGIYLALKTLCNPGDSVILMEPYWLSYPSICSSLDLEVSAWAPQIEEGGILTFHLRDLERLIAVKKPKVLVLNNPNNPSGKIFSTEYIKSLNSILSKNDCYLLIDEVYQDLVFEMKNRPVFFNDENIIRIGSLSKSISLAGLRLGYVQADQRIIQSMQLFNQHIMTCINSLSHELLENIPVALYQNHISLCASIYNNRYNALTESLSNSPLTVLASSSSFYAMIDFGAFFTSGELATEYLKDQHKILVTPGSHYGHSFSQFVRVCLIKSDQKISESFEKVVHALTGQR